MKVEIGICFFSFGFAPTNTGNFEGPPEGSNTFPASSACIPFKKCVVNLAFVFGETDFLLSFLHLCHKHFDALQMKL